MRPLFTPAPLASDTLESDQHVLTLSASLFLLVLTVPPHSQEYPALFAMLWKRLTDLEHVMHVQKALHVVEYLLRHAAERFVSDAKRRARDIAALQKYKHYDENNQDDAREARARAKAVYALLMDDQLLAQERGKSARLESEGRLGGTGYDNDAGNVYDEDHDEDASPTYTAPAPAPVRRAPTATGASSGAMRRRSIDDDPFDNPVIPAAVASTGSSSKPRPKAPTTAAPAKAAPAPAPEPEEDDEAAEAARKAAKKEKKRRKKEEEARRLAAEEAAAASSSRARASPPGGQDFDLTAYAESAPAPFGGDVDIMTGFSAQGASNGGGAGGDLDDLFARQSLHDDGGDLFTQHQQHDPFQQQASQDFGFESSASPAPSAHTPSPTGTDGLVNLNNLLSEPERHAAKSRARGIDAGVSMSMMRSIQPLGVSAEKAQAQAQAAEKLRTPGMPGMPGYGGAAAYPPVAYAQPYPGLQPGFQHMPPYGHPQQQQPMMAIMPPGMSAPISYGGPGPAGSLPFAAPAASSGYTAMRPAPKMSSNGVPIFDVVPAQARAVEPTNYLGHGAPTNGPYGRPQNEYQSFYGKANGGTQPRF